MQRRMGDRPGYMIGGDAMRGMAMLGVMVFHAASAVSANVGPEAAADPVHAFGDVGPFIFRLDVSVWIFFALSGYLVGGPFARAWVEGRDWPHFGRYASKRIRRIVPAFWVVVGALYLIYGSMSATRTQLIETWFFLQAFDRSPFEALFVQGWTVGVELMFYLSLPVAAIVLSRLRLVRGSRTGRLLWLLGVLAALTVVSLVLRERAEPAGGVARSVVGVFWAFTPGIALAALEGDFRARFGHSSPGADVRRGKLIAGVLWVVGLGAFGIYWATMTIPGTWTSELCNFFIAAGLLGAVLTSQWSWGRTWRVVDGPVLHALGRWSYGFYLVHVAIVRELSFNLPDVSNGVALVYCAGITLVVGLSLAALSWWLIEEPILEKRRPRSPWKTARDATEPPSPPAEDRAVAATAAASR